MSTRGLIGFRLNGQDKLTYNHFDSYPAHMLVKILTDMRELIAPDGLPELRRRVEEILMVGNEDDIPSAEELEFFRDFLDESVGDTSNGLTWYNLLRRAQGNLLAYLSAGVMIDSAYFIEDSLFCEWAYIINLDTNCLEVYEGFNRDRREGRYAQDAKPNEGGYLPCSLRTEISFDLWPKTKDDAIELAKHLEGIEDD
jgi:hypothetical protein